MYTAVLMLAMTTGAESIDHGRRNCHGCSGCYGSCSGTYYSGCCCGGGSRRMYAVNYGSTPYYASGPYYSPHVVVQGPSNNVRRAFYYDPNQSGAAIRVLVPHTDAEIWFDGTPTRQRGMERTYVSPALEPGSYRYTIKGQWTEDGRTVHRERTVDVQPGQPFTVDFRNNADEKLAAPKTNAGKKEK